jgi:hypothetical protein
MQNFCLERAKRSWTVFCPILASFCGEVSAGRLLLAHNTMFVCQRIILFDIPARF